MSKLQNLKLKSDILILESKIANPDTIYIDESIDFTYTIFQQSYYGREYTFSPVKEGMRSVYLARLWIKTHAKGEDYIIAAVAEKWTEVRDTRYEIVK